MRVLDTTSLEFKEFPDLPDASYAILSHRWGAEEVTYKEYRKNRDNVRCRAGYNKVVEFCHVARQRGFRYAWVDTCCIDKRSSAELSEAINSMYRWYRESTDCYVFLEDYRPDDPRSVGACEWFTRGWTLQELLAPTYCVFFTRAWEIIGHKHRWNCLRCDCWMKKRFTPPNLTCGPDLLPQLAAAANIPEEVLSGLKEVRSASVAQRMSWASRRSTTRVEDLAYSLLGLFDIHMPLIYGEGIRAFRRLQEEIIRNSDDTSIFCFNMERMTALRDSLALEQSLKDPTFVPFLADRPSQFLQCSDVRRGIVRIHDPYSVAQTSLSMVTDAYTRVRTEHDSHRIYAIPLGCGRMLEGIWETGTGIWEEFFLVVVQVHNSRAHFTKLALQCSTEDPTEFDGANDEEWELTEPQMFHIRR
jgi:hypothetical protein